jgi:hypothetical protein
MNSKFLQSFLAKKLRADRPPNEGWLDGVWKRHDEIVQEESCRAFALSFTTAGSNRKSIVERLKPGQKVGGTAVSRSVKDGQPIAERDE